MTTHSMTLRWMIQVCAEEWGWGAAAGWARAAPSLSWMTWRWSQTPRFPAQRTSSAKPSRSPRISRSCCELLRRTNMTASYPAQKEYMWLWQKWLPSFRRSLAQRLWEALCACWPPARTGFRASAGRRCLQRAARDRTCSWSPSRSSNVLMTLPRQPSSLSPSPQRRIPTNSTYRAAKPSASQFCSYLYF